MMVYFLDRSMSNDVWRRFHLLFFRSLFMACLWNSWQFDHIQFFDKRKSSKIDIFLSTKYTQERWVIANLKILHKQNILLLSAIDRNQFNVQKIISNFMSKLNQNAWNSFQWISIVNFMNLNPFFILKWYSDVEKFREGWTSIFQNYF